MKTLLALAARIDALNRAVGRGTIWMILAATVVCALNAVARKTLDLGSNALLELQWYLFAAAFLLAAGDTLRAREHVRIDVVVSRLSPRTQAALELFGLLVFLLPVCAVVLRHALPYFVQAFASGEVSGNAGGLVLWPAYALIPLGFALLALQGLSEAIKRLAQLRE